MIEMTAPVRNPPPPPPDYQQRLVDISGYAVNDVPDDPEHGKSKTQPDLIQTLLDRCRCNPNKGGVNSIAIDVWIEFGWVVDINDAIDNTRPRHNNRKTATMIKSPLTIVSGNLLYDIQLNGVSVFFGSRKYIPGVWSLYLIDEMKLIADEIERRAARMERRRKARERLYKMRRAAKELEVERMADDASLFGVWDEREQDRTDKIIEGD